MLYKLGKLKSFSDFTEDFIDNYEQFLDPILSPYLIPPEKTFGDGHAEELTAVDWDPT